MKKLLVLLMVLGLASMASATLQISVDGDQEPVDSEITIAPSDHLVLDIWTDSDISAGVGETYLALVVDTMYGTIDYTTGIDNYPEDGGIMLEHSVSAYGALDGLLPAGEDGIFGAISLGTVSLIPAGATIFDQIDFHCEAGNYDTAIHLVATDGSTASIVDTVIVHQIPEPITIALLGLGGLFLRRRK